MPFEENKLSDEKAVARANPGMGNKYAMKKALDNLSQARNVTQANNIDNDVKWTKSADVFKKLQDEVRSGIKGEKYDGSSKGKKGEKLVVVEMDTNYKIMHYVCLNCKDIYCFFFCGDLRVKEGV